MTSTPRACRIRWRDAELSRGTVTFLFTDIEDSTELLKRLGEAYAELLSAHRRIVRDAFTASDGIEMDTQGDAFFFVFPRARDAVRRRRGPARPRGCDLAGRSERSRANRPAHGRARDPRRGIRRPGRRAGGPHLHRGTWRADSPVRDHSRVARLRAAGGRVRIPLGQRHLRGIDEPERVYEVAIDDLELEDAEPRTAVPASHRLPSSSRSRRGIDRRSKTWARGSRQASRSRCCSKLEEKLGRGGGTRGPRGREAFGVDDIAARMQSLGDEIDARISAALAKKGISSDDPRSARVLPRPRPRARTVPGAAPRNARGAPPALVVEARDVRAGGPDAERVRLPPVLECRMLDAHGEGDLLDLVQSSSLEELGEVACVRSGQLRFVLDVGIELARGLPVDAERPWPPP